MVDIVSMHRLCEEPGCEKQPSFGIEGDNRPTRCATHKTVNG